MTGRHSSPPGADRSWARPSALAALALLAAVPPATAADAGRGQAIAAQGPKSCASCHGARGEGDAAIASPRLAGLQAGYLERQLAAYADATRAHESMVDTHKALDVPSRADVAAHYAGLPAPAAPATRAPAALIAAGEALATRGAWDAKIPACKACHGPAGHGVGMVFPALAGQHASYIESQLQAWRRGERRNDPQALMRTVASRLSDDQIAAVAAYYATLR